MTLNQEQVLNIATADKLWLKPNPFFYNPRFKSRLGIKTTIGLYLRLSLNSFLVLMQPFEKTGNR